MARRQWIRLDCDWEDAEWLDGMPLRALAWLRLICWVRKYGYRGCCRRPLPLFFCTSTRTPQDVFQDMESTAVEFGALRVEDGMWIVPHWTRDWIVPTRRGNSRWKKLRKIVLRRDDYRCTYCGSSRDVQCDHVVPKSRGGRDEINNLVAACGDCNRSKGARTPEEWLQ